MTRLLRREKQLLGGGSSSVNSNDLCITALFSSVPILPCLGSCAETVIVVITDIYAVYTTIQMCDMISVLAT